MAEILSNEIGRKIRYIDLREEDARKALKEIDMNEWIIDVMMELYSITRAGYGSQTTSVVEDHYRKKTNIHLHSLPRIMLGSVPLQTGQLVKR